MDLPIIQYAWKTIAQGFSDLVFPESCISCSSTGEGRLCRSCEQDILFTGENRCLKCGTALGAFSGLRKNCPECRSQSYPFRNVYAFCRYREPVKDLIHSLKYGKDFSALPVICRIIRQGIELQKVNDTYDCTVPVPLFKGDEMRRGFNQAAEIAAIASEELKTITVPLLKKRRKTPKQVSLHKSERRRNLEDVFCCSDGVCTQKTVLLVDDVFTTGSTLAECARVLRKQGSAKTVDVLVLAR